MKPYYSKKVLQHFTNPKNFGKLKKPDGIGKVGNPRCGDLMELSIKVKETKGREIIQDIKFQTLGCAAAVATSDMICEMVKGKKLDDALKVGYQDVADELGYLPQVKVHCAHLAQEGLKAAVHDYKQNKLKKNN